MPTIDRAKLLERYQQHIEHCILSYKLYADSLQYSHDPFNAYHRSNSTTQAILKAQDSLVGSNKAQKHLNYASYDLDPEQLTLRQPTFYGDGRQTGVYFNPPEFTQKIGRVITAAGEKDFENSSDNDSIDIYVFEGSTGAIDGKQGVTSPMGYVAYNKETKEITVSFRGSRSSSAKKAIRDAILTHSGNADWVTDMQVTGELAAYPEISPTGEFQDGFAQSYLSCRDSLINIIGKIKQSAPRADLKMSITGHSLGGALATLMFIDTKSGSLQQQLSEVTDAQTAQQLCSEAEAFPVSNPPVCDEAVIIGMDAASREKYHRAYYQNDIVVTGANILRRKSKGHFKYIENPSNLNLGRTEQSGLKARFDIAAHDISLIHDTVQRQRGIPDTEIKKYFIRVNRELNTTNSSPLSPKQNAAIALQFNSEYFLTMARTSIGFKDEYISHEQALIAAIEEAGQIFNDDPYASAEKFEQFKNRLQQVVTALETTRGVESRQAKKARITYLSDTYSELSRAFSEIQQQVTTLHHEHPEIGAIDQIILSNCSELIECLVPSTPHALSLQDLDKIKEGIEALKASLPPNDPITNYELAALKGITDVIEKFVEESREFIDPEQTNPDMSRKFADTISDLISGLNKFKEGMIESLPVPDGEMLSAPIDSFIGKIVGIITKAIQNLTDVLLGKAISKKIFIPSTQRYMHDTLEGVLQTYERTDINAITGVLANNYDEKLEEAQQSSAPHI